MSRAMRLRALGSLALLACGASHPASHDAGADAGAPAAACEPGSLALDGASNVTPHGVYAMTNVALVGNAFSATLPAGGSVALTWNGNASAAFVPVVGTLAIPPDDGGAPVVWCVDVPSTLRLENDAGVLDLALQPEPTIACSPEGDPNGVKTTAATGCFVPSG